MTLNKFLQHPLITRELMALTNKGRSSGLVQLIISLPSFPVAILIIVKPYGGGTAEASNLFPILIYLLTLLKTAN